MPGTGKKRVNCPASKYDKTSQSDVIIQTKEKRIAKLEEKPKLKANLKFSEGCYTTQIKAVRVHVL